MKFKLKNYTITATAGENGTINPNGNVIVAYGKDITFNFKPNENYDIDKITVDGKEIEHTGNLQYTFNGVTANHTIHITFKLKTYTITPSAGNNGTISPNEAVSVPYGSNQVFTFKPDDKYEIDTLFIDNKAITSNITDIYEFENVKSNHTIHVTFKPKTYIDEQIEKITALYPNPIIDIFTVESDELINSIKIYNVLGKEVLNIDDTSNNIVTVDVTALPEGVYNIIIYTNNGLIFRKIMKTR
ncbi:hypothetical protein SDC9_144307 [bioreactor metagenome]|uniref:Secretion system C-terminal sorting domain-containing protein n=1 Tax=bioreactor metagenome TaxID=1076179 RepID=A0A645E5Q4_9ZZZZ